MLAQEIASMTSWGREKIDQRLGGRLRCLLGEVMPAVDSKAAHVAGPFFPGCQRSFRFRRNAAGRAPDSEQRTTNRVAGGAIGFVMREIGGAAGAIVFAGGMDAQRIAEKGVVMGERTRIECGEALDLGPRRCPRIEEKQRVFADHRL